MRVQGQNGKLALYEDSSAGKKGEQFYFHGCLNQE
jgi:hypothetical protein